MKKSSSHSWSTRAKALTIIALWASTATVVFPTSSASLLPPYPETTIHIMNGMQAGSPAVSLHCKSADDDLGFQQVGLGQEFRWSFTRNVWFVRGMTLFFCHFWWNSKELKADVYNTWDFDVSKDQFYYKVREQGVFFSYDQKTWRLREWDN